MLDFYLLPYMPVSASVPLALLSSPCRPFTWRIAAMNGRIGPGVWASCFEGLLLVYLVLLATAPAVISISIREGVVAQSMLELPRWIVFTLLGSAGTRHEKLKHCFPSSCSPP